MKAIRKPNGEIVLQDAPAGTVPLVVDDTDTPFGTVPIRLQVRLPDGRVVAVAIEADSTPLKPSDRSHRKK